MPLDEIDDRRRSLAEAASLRVGFSAELVNETRVSLIALTEMKRNEKKLTLVTARSSFSRLSVNVAISRPRSPDFRSDSCSTPFREDTYADEVDGRG